MMEERGMVAPSDGTNKPRKVLMSEAQFEDYLSGAASAGASGAGAIPYEEPVRGAERDVAGAEIAPVNHTIYGGVPGGVPADDYEDADEPDEHIKDISDLIGDDDPPFVTDDE
jgi:hypothetical protein